MQGVVEGAVAGVGEAVADDLAGGDAVVQSAQLGDELDRDPTGSATRGVAWARAPRKVGAELGGEPAVPCAGGDKLGEQAVEPVCGLGASLDQVVAVLDEDPQRAQGLVDRDRLQLRRGVAAMATETASASSLLRPCPVDKVRTRAASSAGTSVTAMSSATSRASRGPPSPVAPSMAHRAWG